MESKNVYLRMADYCNQKLNLSDAKLSDEYYYNSLPLCVVDAVFSIGIKYTITRNVVINVSKFLQIPRLRSHGTTYSDIRNQYSNSDFLEMCNKHSIDELTQDIFKNRNRTSPSNGILKSDAVRQFATVLKKYNVNYLQDVKGIIGNANFENEIKLIPGQRSGLSTKYFYMLTGDENFVKPDRMITRFIGACIGAEPSSDNASEILIAACELLKPNFPKLTPRILDHEIWKFQKEQ